MTTAESVRKIKYFPALDGLRAIAVLAVVGFHARIPGDRLFAHGSYGVDLFFAISGFLITTLLAREYERTGTIDLSGFYGRRVARIFPLYYAVLALYCVLVALTQHNTAGTDFWRNLPAFATYTTQWVVSPHDDGSRVIFYFAWSLAVEEQFYLLWPWVLRWGKGALWLGLAAMLVVAVAPLFAAWMPHVDALGLGCLLALLVQHPRTGPAVVRALSRQSVLLLSLVGVFILFAVRTPFPFGEGIIAAICVGAAVVRPDAWGGTLLTSRVLRHIGAVSYGVYLLHQLALNAIRSTLQWQGYTLALFGALAAVGVATVSAHIFELPVRTAIRRRWESQPDQLARTPSPVSAEQTSIAPTGPLPRTPVVLSAEET